MDFEPMDVDKSASSASKMDISFNDTDSDIYVLDNDDISYSNITIKKEVPDLEVSNDEANNDLMALKNLKSYGKVKIMTENPENFQTVCPDKSGLFESQQEVLANKDVTKVVNESVVKPVQFNSVKTYHIKKQHLKRKETPSKFVHLIAGAFLLFLSVITYQIMNYNCAEEINLQILRKSFNENLFGQSAAANKIIETLNIEDKSKIIFIYGGTGVGKTFAVSLMLDKLWNLANVYHYTMPTFADTFSPELTLGLTVCKSSILVVDDLTRNDVHITTHIQNILAKSDKLGKNITIVLIYNCDIVTDNFVKKCDSSYYTQLEQSFRHISVEKYFVQFQPLQQEHLKKCIERELGNRKVSGPQMNIILKSFDVSLDGCKGVYTKIKLLNVI